MRSNGPVTTASAYSDDVRLDAPGLRWAVAGPGAQRGTIRAALCERARCEPASTWAYEILAPPSFAEATKKGFPAWASWTLAAVGVAAAASVLIVTRTMFGA